MLNLFLTVSLIIGGSSANDFFRKCNLTVCGTDLGHDFSQALPNEEQLKTMCPPVLERFQCMRTAFTKCFGKDLQELVTSDNTSVALFSNLILNLESVTIDLCDENSLLHEGYKTSVECVNEVVYSDEDQTKCLKEAVNVSRDFQESQGILRDASDPTQYRISSNCLIVPYTFACYSVEIQEACGDLARKTALDILKRVQFLAYILKDCTEEQLTEMKTTYLEFLSLDEQKKTWFSEVFNARK